MHIGDNSVNVVMWIVVDISSVQNPFEYDQIKCTLHYNVRNSIT